jgi:hypothetical protein
MNQSHLVKLFTALGLILLIISVNTWLAVQGGEKILSVSLISNEKAGAAFFGLMLCSVLLLLVAAVGLLHARRYGQNVNRLANGTPDRRAKRTPGEHPFVRFSAAILPSRPMLPLSRRAQRRSRTAASSAAARRACS